LGTFSLDAYDTNRNEDLCGNGIGYDTTGHNVRSPVHTNTMKTDKHEKCGGKGARVLEDNQTKHSVRLE